MAQLMPLPLTVCCFSEIQIGFTFLVLAQPGSTGKRAVKRVSVFVNSAYLEEHFSQCSCGLKTEVYFITCMYTVLVVSALYSQVIMMPKTTIFSASVADSYISVNSYNTSIVEPH